SEKILFGELQPGHIIICDVEGWDGEEGAWDKARFVFRGERRRPGFMARPLTTNYSGHTTE
ncbi:MAG TPA: hypothetical protein VGR06_01120, partial [Actinophytocola sp.]|uniref:hypothetical protein n=1 Tax=Actinophytocola sp. TaxID=1872138 RepID=UPI002DFFF9A2|nr:hypothetical protein [Actinophytocola sp.]